MPTRRRSSQPWKGRFGVAFLSLLAFLFVAAAGILFMRLLDAERDMDSIVREDAVWAVFQTDRHMRELHRHAQLIAETGNTS